MPTPTSADLIEAAREVVRAEANAVAGVADQIDDGFAEVTRLLLGCAGKVVICGSGTSGAVARRMAHLLSVCGTPAVFLHPMDSLHGTMGAITEDDVLIAISRGGETAELNELARRVRERGVTVIGLTAEPGSGLGAVSDVTVRIATPDDGDPGGVIAMGSTLAVSTWGDALAVTLMRLRRYSWTQVLFTHPAGAVGLRENGEPPAELTPIGDEKE
jgi:arabinose-5-phosphate isomerase